MRISGREDSAMHNRPTVVLTGATKGIGLAIATQIANKGIPLHCIARDRKMLEDLCVALGSRTEMSHSSLDLRDMNQIAEFTNEWSRPLLGIVNNAGEWGEASLSSKGGSDLLQKLWKINVAAPLAMVSGLLEKLATDGRIINITSQLSHRGRPGFGAYCASKHALLGLTRCWAQELSPSRITVNAISPGWVSTDSNRVTFRRIAKSLSSDERKVITALEGSLPQGRLIEPTEVAQLVMFLLSRESRGLTGQALEVL